MKALAFVTLSSATGPEKCMARRGLTLQPSSSSTEADLVAARGIDAAIGCASATRRPVDCRGSGTVCPVEGKSACTSAAAAPDGGN